MKKYLFIFVFVIFNQTFGQIPKLKKTYSLNPTIDYFIDNLQGINHENIVIIVSFFYDKKEKSFLLDLTCENVKLIFDKSEKNIYKIYKYKDYNLLLIGQNSQQIKFLNSIIKNLKPNINSNVEFLGKQKYGISNDPYSWYLDFNNKMNIKNIYITEDESTEKYAKIVSKIMELSKK